MTFWTTHLRAGAGPVLVREGFSWGAVIFGPLWLFAHRAWIAGVLALALGVLVVGLTSDGIQAALLLVLAVGQGLFGRDLQRWSLDRRGFALAHVVAARDEEAALARLLEHRPELVSSFLPAGRA